MFGTIIDLFLIDTIETEQAADDSIIVDDDVDSDIDEVIEDDSDTGNLFVIFFLGGSDIDEPYTDIASILTLLQFLEYFEIESQESDEDDNE